VFFISIVIGGINRSEKNRRWIEREGFNGFISSVLLKVDVRNTRSVKQPGSRNGDDDYNGETRYL
jgi:hypothetical protein